MARERGELILSSRERGEHCTLYDLSLNKFEYLLHMADRLKRHQLSKQDRMAVVGHQLDVRQAVWPFIWRKQDWYKSTSEVLTCQTCVTCVPAYLGATVNRTGARAMHT